MIIGRGIPFGIIANFVIATFFAASWSQAQPTEAGTDSPKRPAPTAIEAAAPGDNSGFILLPDVPKQDATKGRLLISETPIDDPEPEPVLPADLFENNIGIDTGSSSGTNTNSILAVDQGAEEPAASSETPFRFPLPGFELFPPSSGDGPTVQLSFGLQHNPYFEAENEDSAFLLDASGSYDFFTSEATDEHRFSLLSDWGLRLLTGVSEEEDEALLLLDGQWLYDPDLQIRAGAGATYAYERALVDAASIDLETDLTQLNSHQLGGRSFVETDLTDWIVARFDVKLDAFRFEESIEDYLSGTFGAEFEGRYDPLGSLVRFSYATEYQLFDERRARSFAGGLKSTDLRWLTHTYAVMNRHHFYDDGGLTMETRLYFSFRDDNGGGWYDHAGFGVTEAILASFGSIDTEFRAGVSSVAYDVRENSVGEELDRSLVHIGTRIAYNNASRLRPFFDLDLLNQGSNNPDQEFLQATMMLGAEVGF